MLIVVDDPDVVVVHEQVALPGSTPGEILILRSHGEALVESAQRPEGAVLKLRFCVVNVLRMDLSSSRVVENAQRLVVEVLVAQAPAAERRALEPATELRLVLPVTRDDAPLMARVNCLVPAKVVLGHDDVVVDEHQELPGRFPCAEVSGDGNAEIGVRQVASAVRARHPF